MNLRQGAKHLLPPIVVDAISWMRNASEDKAVHGWFPGREVPWGPGYNLYRKQLITQTLADDTLMERFRRGESLPSNYGVGVDERCIEYPWRLSHLRDGPEVLLDAGSTLNYEFILDHPTLRGKLIHILTLAPEANCYWQKGISYLFHDLRDIPVRAAYYDTICCLSTLEHIGCDNTLYTHNDAGWEHGKGHFILAMQEFRRVLKTGGTLLLTVPFGLYRHFGTFQQFDRKMLTRAVEAFGKVSEVTEVFYRYTPDGWEVASAEDCAECEYVEWITRSRSQWPDPLPVEPDLAAAARAVACVRLIKE